MWMLFSSNNKMSTSDIISAGILRDKGRGLNLSVENIDETLIHGTRISCDGIIQIFQKGISIPNPDYILPWDGATISDTIFRLLVAYSDRGVPCLNPPSAIYLTRDKQLMMSVLSANGIRIPQTSYLKITLSNLIDISQSICFPTLLKPVIGTNGIGVTLIKSKEEFVDICQLALSITRQNELPIIAQNFISNSFGKATRLLVLDGVLLIAYDKTEANRFKAIASSGANVSRLQVNLEMKDIASKIHLATNLRFFGVDLLHALDGYYVCDVNSAPSLQAPVQFLGDTFIADIYRNFINDK